LPPADSRRVAPVDPGGEAQDNGLADGYLADATATAGCNKKLYFVHPQYYPHAVEILFRFT
jgi:hypothetical protein